MQGGEYLTKVGELSEGNIKCENHEEKYQLHDCPITAKCILGHTFNWPNSCQDLRGGTAGHLRFFL